MYVNDHNVMECSLHTYPQIQMLYNPNIIDIAVFNDSFVPQQTDGGVKMSACLQALLTLGLLSKS